MSRAQRDAGQSKFGITVQAVPQQLQSRLHITWRRCRNQRKAGFIR